MVGRQNTFTTGFTAKAKELRQHHHLPRFRVMTLTRYPQTKRIQNRVQIWESIV
jgi:hypothetical protein